MVVCLTQAGFGRSYHADTVYPKSRLLQLAHLGIAVGTSICHAGSRTVNSGSRERACGHPARIDRCQGTHCYQFKSGGGRKLIQPDWGTDGERKLIQSGSLVPWPTSNAVITPILCTRSWPVHRFVNGQAGSGGSITPML